MQPPAPLEAAGEAHRILENGHAGGKIVLDVTSSLGWGDMTAEQEAPRVVSASREIAAGAGRIFELIADPAAQPRWDGNDNLAGAPAGQRVRARR